tara:strand:- start:37424 stop:38086 length:663 start_codon:yes stop_codon:yes gene_type:complete
MDIEKRSTVSGPLAYLFTDFECTGLDEHVDEIVEIGIIGVDEDLSELFSYTTLIQPNARTIERIESQPIVLAMMEANGLIYELREAVGGNDLPDLATAVSRINELIDTFGAGGRVTLGGSGVATYDYTFIKAQAPELAAKLTYWCNDVGDSRRRWRAATGGDLVPIDAGKNHRAFEDVTIHLEEARYYRALFQKMTEVFGGSDFETVMAGLESVEKVPAG